MVVRIHKWGNSLALRIPKPLAAEAGLKDNSQVELSLHKGKLIISPPKEPKPSLAELLKKVNKKNLHREFQTGPAVGGEDW